VLFGQPVFSSPFPLPPGGVEGSPHLAIVNIVATKFLFHGLLLTKFLIFNHIRG
jgi:hypothetical protein